MAQAVGHERYVEIHVNMVMGHYPHIAGKFSAEYSDDDGLVWIDLREPVSWKQGELTYTLHPQRFSVGFEAA